MNETRNEKKTEKRKCMGYGAQRWLVEKHARFELCAGAPINWDFSEMPSDICGLLWKRNYELCAAIERLEFEGTHKQLVSRLEQSNVSYRKWNKLNNNNGFYCPTSNNVERAVKISEGSHQPCKQNKEFFNRYVLDADNEHESDYTGSHKHHREKKLRHDSAEFCLRSSWFLE